MNTLLKSVGIAQKGEDGEEKLNEDGTQVLCVPFTNFLDFMIRQSTAEDTAEQVKASFKVLAGEKVSPEAVSQSAGTMARVQACTMASALGLSSLHT